MPQAIGCMHCMCWVYGGLQTYSEDMHVLLSFHAWRKHTMHTLHNLSDVLMRFFTLPRLYIQSVIWMNSCAGGGAVGGRGGEGVGRRRGARICARYGTPHASCEAKRVRLVSILVPSSHLYTSTVGLAQEMVKISISSKLYIWNYTHIEINWAHSISPSTWPSWEVERLEHGEPSTDPHY